jgi:hypothetical protein
MIFISSIILIVSIFLTPGFARSGEDNKDDSYMNSSNSISAIRFLTSQTKRVSKNYENPPLEFQRSSYNIESYIRDDQVFLIYPFPLIDKEKSVLMLQLSPLRISLIVDKFGVEAQVFRNNNNNNNNDTEIVLPSDNNELKRLSEDFYEGSILLDDIGNLEIDYPRIVSYSYEFAHPIAIHIINELKRIGKDGYFQRVQSTLNFVQFISYGQPEFDHNNFYFHGLALPPESLVLNYSDCDSKSVLFASILSHLIDEKNIILILCDVAHENEDVESHMMVGVKGLGISHGQVIEFNNDVFHLLETTSPSEIGAWSWSTFDLIKVIQLNKNQTNTHG